jgi:hypothetical protein
MFGNLITRSRRRPMPINGHPNILLFHLAASFSVYIFATLNFVDI